MIYAYTPYKADKIFLKFAKCIELHDSYIFIFNPEKHLT